MKPLVIIPARAGSKGLPGKNWKLLHGKPLIQYTIEVALETFAADEICITTDAPEVMEIAQNLGVSIPFVRPEVLASDNAGSRDVMLHALNFWEAHYYKPDVLVLLQPTSPFRTSQHIQDGLKLYSQQIDMVVGVKETQANPYYVLREEDERGYLKPSKVGAFTRRQDCPKVFEINGAFYAINPESLLQKNLSDFDRVLKLEMDAVSSHDIDDALDWLVAESIVKTNFGGDTRLR